MLRMPLGLTVISSWLRARASGILLFGMIVWLIGTCSRLDSSAQTNLYGVDLLRLASELQSCSYFGMFNQHTTVALTVAEKVEQLAAGTNTASVRPYLVAWSHACAGQLDKAYNSLMVPTKVGSRKGVLELTFEGLLLERAGNTQSAIEAWEQAGAAPLLDRRCSLLQGTDIQQAIKWCEYAVTVAPDLSRHATLGQLYQVSGQLEKAKAVWLKILDLAQTSKHRAAAHVQLGDIAASQGEYQCAKEHYYQAIHLDPSAVGGYRGMGLLSLSLGELTLARDWLQQALAVDPSDGYVYYWLGEIALEHEHDYARALMWYDRGLAVNPDSSLLLLRRGLALFHLGQFGAAASAYDSALDNLPTKEQRWWHWYGLGQAYEALGRCAEAMMAYQRAMLLDSSAAAPQQALDRIIQGQCR